MCANTCFCIYMCFLSFFFSSFFFCLFILFIYSDLFGFYLPYFIMLLFLGCLFSNEIQKPWWSQMEQGELEGLGGAETVIRIYW